MSIHMPVINSYNLMTTLLVADIVLSVYMY